MMSFKIRTSKFRHVFGSGTRKDGCYEGIKLSRSSETYLCAVNPKFVSVITDCAGGGSFIVIPIDKTGRVDAHAPRVTGHAGPVLDIKWNPFNDNMVASSSEDKTVKLWNIPDHGLITHLKNWTIDLHGHTKRVDTIEWHPTADGILLSSSLDYKCIVWNTQQAEPVTVIHAHTQPIYSTAWNRDGSLLSTTSRDKMIRVIDPRTTLVAMETQGHTGSRPSKSLFLGDYKMFSSGFSAHCDRQYSIWDLRNMVTSMKTETIDKSHGVMMTFYDSESNVVFIAGKGDGNIRYYEIVSDPACCHYLGQYQSSHPQKGMGHMPKRGCNPWKCEIMRFYKVHADKSLCEPVSMIVPRRAETFQEDLFLPTNSIHFSSTADQWISGINRDPVLVSMLDGSIIGKPKMTTSKAVQQQDMGLSKAPVITTYVAVDRKTNQANDRFTRQKSFPSSQPITPDDEPASIKNIRQLSLSVERVRVGPGGEGCLVSPTSPLTNGCHGNKPLTRSFPCVNGYTTPTSNDHNDQETVQRPKSAVSPTSSIPTRMDIEIIEKGLTCLQSPIKTNLAQFKKRYSDSFITLPNFFSLSSHQSSNSSEAPVIPDDDANTLSNENGSQIVHENTYSPDKYREIVDVWNKKVDKFWSTSKRALPRRSLSLRLPQTNKTLHHSSILDDSSFQNNSPNEDKVLDVGEKRVQTLNRSRSFHDTRCSLPTEELDSENMSIGMNLKKAYFSQVEEIKSLKEQLNMKDTRIRQLEEDLKLMKVTTS